MIAVALLACVPARAVLVTGRFSVGGFASKETFTDNEPGSNSNDFETFSSRMYLKLQKMGDFDAIFDIRDTHDFFDKLDSERLHLTGANSFQIREADARYSRGSYYANVGRFGIQEAGSAYVDGGEAGYRLNKDLRAGVFGGHNPKRPEDYYMRGDTPDIDYGVYLAYQPQNPSWQKIVNSSLAYYTDSVNGFVDRRYLFSNLLYQWNYSSRIISNIYVDFVPRVFVQNGILIYQQGYTPAFDSTVTLTAFDTIEYSRRTGVLEQLPSSPYREAAVGARYRFSSGTRGLLDVRYGDRLADQKDRKEARAGMNWIGIFSKRVDMTAYAGYREEFIARGPLAYYEINYFSKAWEFGFNADYSIQQRFDNDPASPQSLHPLTTELSAARIFSNSLFATVSAQYAYDEIVNIYSGFFTLTYRFGTHDMAPLRDGAPPRRSL